MKFPFATLLLFAAVAGAYFFLSGGLLYLDQATLDGLALNSSKSPFGFFSYMFVHVGIVHLAGNLLPLLLFALLLELSLLAAMDVLVVFVGAGIIASALFSALNPSVALVGASAGVSGLIGAAVSVKPKYALPLLLLSPFLFTFFVLPVVGGISFSQQQAVFESVNNLNREFDQYAHENNTQAASEMNAKLSNAERQKKVLEEGVKREASTPSDFFVHMVGVAFGVAYVFFLRRSVFQKGAQEFLSTLRSLPFARKTKNTAPVKSFAAGEPKNKFIKARATPAKRRSKRRAKA